MSNSYRSAAIVKSSLLMMMSLCCAPQAALSCINEYEDKTPVDERLLLEHRLHAEQKQQYLEGLNRGHVQPPSDETLDKLRLAAYEGDYRAKSDYAVALVRRGDLAQAIEIFQEIEQQHPGEYVVAANLGTAFELAGDDEKALKWITIGLRRNPQSHFGSEWLHVKILQAKLSLVKNPSWLQSNSILGLAFGPDGRPTTEVRDLDGHTISLDQAREALEYQLRERLSLVSPKDAVVSSLLSHLGAILALTRVNAPAIGVYELAASYSPDNTAWIHEQIQRLNYPPSEPPPFYAVLSLVVSVIALIGAVGLYLQRRPERANQMAF
jgi:tetratricopeptide (TPR) repeat protein